MPAYVDSMAWAESGGVPWHKEGHAVSDDLTPDEMAEAAGITWTVSKRPSYTIEAPEWIEGVAQTVGTRSKTQKLCSSTKGSVRRDKCKWKQQVAYVKVRIFGR